MRVVSWNINGLRSVMRQSFVKHLIDLNCDILCLQEIKTDTGVELPDGYHLFVNPSSIRGYAGTAMITKLKPLTTFKNPIGNSDECSGRSILMEFEKFSILNIYVPHGRRDKSELHNKLYFYTALYNFIRSYAKPLIVSGDFNVAHSPVDLARPKQNINNTMFTEQERHQINKLTEIGLVDSFRALHPNKAHHYTWWPYAYNARQRNVGWRIDYIFVNSEIGTQLRAAQIHSEIGGSDHCPISIDFDT